MEATDPRLNGLRARAVAIPLDHAKRRAWQEQFAQIPSMKASPMVMDIADEQLVHLLLPQVTERFSGGLASNKTVNGSVLAGMFDAALGIAGVLHFLGQRAGTCELSMKFMRPVIGERVDVWAATVKRGGTLAFVEAELYSAGKLCATSTGIVAASGSQSAPADALW